MPELRKDPIVGRWVIIAKSRARRPHDFAQAPPAAGGAFCPFCEGHEDKTPAEIIAYRNAGSQPNREGWRVRVVPNRYPALEIEGKLGKRGEGMYDLMAGIGAHEVIIESPQHHLRTSDLSLGNLQEVFWAYRDRLVDLKRDPRLVHGMIFKNVGAAAGASLEHTHSQLIVTPIVPISVRDEMAGSEEFYNYRGRCVFCDMIQQELAHGKRVVVDMPGFVAFCPFASRFPFETWILPKAHSSHYENIQRNGVDEIARVLKQVIGKLDAALDSPAYNYIIHTAPFTSQELSHYHWHVEIIPRGLTLMAGFEWGSGFYINPVPPEEAAKFLRELEEVAALSRPTRTAGK